MEEGWNGITIKSCGWGRNWNVRKMENEIVNVGIRNGLAFIVGLIFRKAVLFYDLLIAIVSICYFHVLFLQIRNLCFTWNTYPTIKVQRIRYTNRCKRYEHFSHVFHSFILFSIVLMKTERKLKMIALGLKLNYKSVWEFISSTYTQTIRLRQCKCYLRVNQDKPWESDAFRNISARIVCTFAIRFCFSGSKSFGSLWMPALFSSALCMHCGKASTATE